METTLIDTVHHRFPWPPGAEGRGYSDETPWLAIVNAAKWGPWAVWRHEGKSPPWIPFCLGLRKKAFWREADAERRCFVLDLWAHAADESPQGIVWGDPAKLRRELGVESFVFGRHLAALLIAGWVVYLSDSERAETLEYLRFQAENAEKRKKLRDRDRVQRQSTEKEPKSKAKSKDNIARSRRKKKEPEPKADPEPQPQTVGPPLLAPPPLPVSPFPTGPDPMCTLGQAIPRGLFKAPGGPLDMSDTAGVLQLVRANPRAWDWVLGIYAGLRLPYSPESRRWRENCGSFGRAFLETIGSGLPEPVVAEVLDHDVREAVKLGVKRGRLNKPAVWWSVHKHRFAAAVARCRPP